MTEIIPRTLTGHRGMVAIVVALLSFVFLGFVAFAIDFGYLYVVKNELQNAADAAALAGAAVLFHDNSLCLGSGRPYSCCSGAGTGSCLPAVIDHDNVRETAEAVAGKNYSSGAQVPVPTVEVGHYAFASSRSQPGNFNPTTSTSQMDGWETVPFFQLNSNDAFINAVRVTLSRTDITRFFSRIWSKSDLGITVQATAYVGFAGTVPPGGFDLPISICKQSILQDGNYSCSRGRMIPSSSGSDSETGGWTNYDQPESSDGACVQPTKNDIPITKSSCAGSNTETIIFGRGMGLTNGEVQTTYDGLMKCWVTKNGGTVQGQGNSGNYNILTWPDKIWKVRLPVVDCESGVANCSSVVGVVTVNIVWMTRTGTNSYDEAPKSMGEWTCPAGYTGQQCWEDFRSPSHFNLKQGLGDESAGFNDKTIYFQPDCEVHIPTGGTGGENYGVLARYPLLVNAIREPIGQ